jgi:hypothetical protein
MPSGWAWVDVQFVDDVGAGNCQAVSDGIVIRHRSLKQRLLYIPRRCTTLPASDPRPWSFRCRWICSAICRGGGTKQRDRQQADLVMRRTGQQR